MAQFKKKDTLAWIENHLTIETIFIGLNPVDIDSDSMKHPQISHTQRLISGIFISLVKASYTATYFRNFQTTVCGDMNQTVLILSFNTSCHRV